LASFDARYRTRTFIDGDTRRTHTHTHIMRNVWIVFARYGLLYATHSRNARRSVSMTLTLINAEPFICMHGNDFCRTRTLISRRFNYGYYERINRTRERGREDIYESEQTITHRHHCKVPSHQSVPINRPISSIVHREMWSVIALRFNKIPTFEI